MIKALFLGIIKFVIKLMNIILTPFVSVVTGLFLKLLFFLIILQYF